MKLYIEMNSDETKAINKMMAAMDIDDQIVNETMSESINLKAGRFHTEIDKDLNIKAEIDLKEGFFTFVCKFMERIGRIVLPAIQMVMEATEIFSEQIQKWSEPEDEDPKDSSEDSSKSIEEVEALKKFSK